MIGTRYGLIEGVDRGGYMEYRGIPYAKPPVGELRWRAPQPPEPWEGVWPATDFRNKCVQISHNVPPYDKDFYDDPAWDRPMSEDCLYLHVWAPKGARDCPVALWMHGGAFLGGWGSEKEFDGAAWCARGVILVSIEYRCGIFGFLAHPWLTAEQGGHSGNYGILDQIAALRWVRENIAAFGGDPDNLTIAGQSAGSISVQTLCSSPLARGLFRRAILQSGGSFVPEMIRDRPLAELEEAGLALAEILGAKDLGDLRSRPAEEISAAFGPLMQQMAPRFRGLFLAPCVDGWMLPEGTYPVMTKGLTADVDYLVGSNMDDLGGNTDPADKRKSNLYRGCVAFSRTLAEHGRPPAFVYWFKRELPGDDAGAYHTAELFYTMGTMDRCWRPWTEGDYALAARMQDYWTNFIKTGDPNGSGLPLWKRCGTEEPFVMDLDV